MNGPLFSKNYLGLVYYVCQFLLLQKDSCFTFVGRETYDCYSVFKYILFNAELQTLCSQRLYMTVASIDKYAVYMTNVMENHNRK